MTSPNISSVSAGRRPQMSDLTPFEQEATLAHYLEVVERAETDRRQGDRRGIERRRPDWWDHESLAADFPFSSPEELAVLEAQDHVDAAKEELRVALRPPSGGTHNDRAPRYGRHGGDERHGLLPNPNDLPRDVVCSCGWRGKQTRDTAREALRDLEKLHGIIAIEPGYTQLSEDL